MREKDSFPLEKYRNKNCLGVLVKKKILSFTLI